MKDEEESIPVETKLRAKNFCTKSNALLDVEEMNESECARKEGEVV